MTDRLPCPVCDVLLAVADRYNGTRLCKPCYRSRQQAYYDKMRTDPVFLERRREQARASNRLARSGVTREMHARLTAAAGGRCEICADEASLVVDHDHACCPTSMICGDCIRGMLCGPCNRALGFFRDDPQRLQAGVDYLLQRSVGTRSYARPSTKTLEAVGRSLR